MPTGSVGPSSVRQRPTAPAGQRAVGNGRRVAAARAPRLSGKISRCAPGGMDCMARVHTTTSQRVTPAAHPTPPPAPKGSECQRPKVPTCQSAKPGRVIVWHSLAPSGALLPPVTCKGRVGVGVTPHPSHRSGRAPFRHPARPGAASLGGRLTPQGRPSTPSAIPPGFGYREWRHEVLRLSPPTGSAS